MIVNQIRFETTIFRHAASFFITAGTELNIITIYEAVIDDQRIYDRVISINGAIRHAIHDHQSAAKSCPLQTLHIVVTNGLPGINDADAACVIYVISKEDITFNTIIVSVKKRKRPAGFMKCIISNLVSAGLARNNLQLAIATIKVVILNHSMTIASGEMACPDP